MGFSWSGWKKQLQFDKPMVLYNQYWILDALMGDVQLAPLPIRTPIKEDFRCTVLTFHKQIDGQSHDLP